MMRPAWFVVLGLGIGVGCGSEGQSTFPNGEDGGASSDGGALFLDAGVECSEASKLVYVFSEVGDLYSFLPSTLTFTKIGRISCPTAGLPSSMAVDRNGTAWTSFGDGSVFKVSTRDASCQASGFQPRQEGFIRFGMAFASDAPGAKEETLFIGGARELDGAGELGLGKINLSTMKLTKIASFKNPFDNQAAELTGSGDAKLYGFFTTVPAQLAEITKTDGTTPSPVLLPGVQTGRAWAFSFWGGDFWFYTAPKIAGVNSSVTRYAKSGDGSVRVVKDDVGFAIVGAGVSTCAPVTLR